MAPSTLRTTIDGPLRSICANRYSEAIFAAGGLPIIATCIDSDEHLAALVELSDGLLLTGGDDVDPVLYLNRPLSSDLAATVRMDGPERDRFELKLIRQFWGKKPIMAICRGMQMLNVALGGSLLVDIPLQMPNALEHRRPDVADGIVHEVEVRAGTLMHKLLKRERIGVNSTHHQAVDRLAKELRPSAVSNDGIVEGLELTQSDMDGLPFVLGVQFHPECLWSRFSEHLILFQGFVDACARSRPSQYEVQSFGSGRPGTSPRSHQDDA